MLRRHVSSSLYKFSGLFQKLSEELNSINMNPEEDFEKEEKIKKIIQKIPRLRLQVGYQEVELMGGFMNQNLIIENKHLKEQEIKSLIEIGINPIFLGFESKFIEALAKPTSNIIEESIKKYKDLIQKEEYLNLDIDTSGLFIKRF